MKCINRTNRNIVSKIHIAGKLELLFNEIKSSFLDDKNIQLKVLRLDQIHPEWGGNKYFKLKYNLIRAKELGQDTLLSFGGAFSNHLYALASIGALEGFKTIGLVRGEQNEKLNPTLQFLIRKGMQIDFISREDYRKKTTESYIASLKKKYGDFYLIPEGGSNELAIKGCKEISEAIETNFDFICCSCGTGATLAGIILGLKPKQKAIGFSSLKQGEFLYESIEQLLKTSGDYNFKYNKNWDLILDYHFGGYAKITEELIDFKQAFQQQFNIELDYVYTNKMMYGIFNLVEQDYFKSGSKIVAVHTGGIQGNQGFLV